MIRTMLALLVCGYLMAACCLFGECENSKACKCKGTCKVAEKCDATHVITSETNYYVSGPQQARPPEGKFAAGTEVTLIAEAGSYCQVRAMDGREGYVSADALKALK